MRVRGQWPPDAGRTVPGLCDTGAMAADEDPELEAVLTASRDLGFLGPGEPWIHVEHALAFARAVPQAPTHALDLGSGGGVPGLILARLVWPDASWCLLDGSVKRVAFLETAHRPTGPGERVVAQAGRAEEVGRGAERASFDLVVARSFGPPAVVAECAAPFLVVGGHLVVSEPPDTDPVAVGTPPGSRLRPRPGRPTRSAHRRWRC